MATALKYFTIYFLSGLKFIFGPVFGVANDIPMVIIIALTALGMMTTIYLFTFFGHDIRKFILRFRKNPKVFTKKNRRFVKLWRSYGLIGVCILTPWLLSPPVGGLLANVLGTDKKKLIKWMWISAVGSSAILSFVVKYAYWLIEDFI